jgi:glycine hydroxymethyltransferase
MFERNRYTVERIDPEIFAAIEKENQRQEDHIELIASENYTSPAVMAVQGSPDAPTICRLFSVQRR